jgi:hypothetical protein
MEKLKEESLKSINTYKYYGFLRQIEQKNHKLTQLEKMIKNLLEYDK